MSQFFPHTAYAEDQPLHKTILICHVLYRGFQTGATIGIFTGATRSLLLVRRSAASSFGSAVRSTLPRHVGVGAVIGTGLMIPATVARMWGREEIEWRDRSWRLLENKGQVEVDNWSLIGTAAGAATSAMASNARTEGGRWKRVVGGAGIGNMIGVVGYMLYRHGLKGGQW